MRVYALQLFHDEDTGCARWPWLSMPDREAQKKFLTSFRRSIAAGQPPQLHPWRPLPVVVVRQGSLHPHEPPADLSTLGLDMRCTPLTLSQRAVEALGDLLAPDAELLPLDCQEGRYYLLNVTRLLFPLDLPNSLVKWEEGPFGPQLSSAYILSFQEALLQGVNIFAMPEHALDGYFITDALKERIEAAGLRSNLQPLLVWDSQDPEYFDERYRHNPAQWQRFRQMLLVQQGLAEPPPPPPPPPPREVVEEPLSQEDRQSILNILQAAVKFINRAERLKLQLSSEPKLLVQQVFFQCEKLRRRRDLSQDERENRAIELGLLWGEQVCRAYGWEWVKLDGDHVVVAPDRSAYVSPVVYMYGFFYDPERENNTLLLFNMIGAKGKIPAKPGDYLHIG